MATLSRTVSIPKMLADPLDGRMKSSKVRIVVVLPAPFGPRNPKISPWYTWRFRSWTATNLP